MANPYPQPDSNASALNSQDFFRIHQTMFDAGAVFESEQGSKAIAIGPDSDIARVTVEYPDQTSPTGMNSVVVSKDRTFNGSMYADKSSKYPGSNRPSRIIMYSTDLLQDESWRPAGFNGTTDALVSIRPTIDIIQFFQPAAPQSARNDRVVELEFWEWQPSGGGSLYVAIPFYGREYGSVTFTNRETGAVHVSMTGVCFTLSPTVSQTVTLLTDTAVATTTTLSHVVKASTDGTFDAIVLKFTALTAGVTKNILRVVASDNAL